MKFTLVILALLGHIDAESLSHRHHHHAKSFAHEEPEAKPTGSRLVNMTDADIKKMNEKTVWTNTNYGPYEQKKLKFAQ
jgi:hypothetical protein